MVVLSDARVARELTKARKRDVTSWAVDAVTYAHDLLSAADDGRSMFRLDMLRVCSGVAATGLLLREDENALDFVRLVVWSTREWIAQAPNHAPPIMAYEYLQCLSFLSIRGDINLKSASGIFTAAAHRFEPMPRVFADVVNNAAQVLLEDGTVGERMMMWNRFRELQLIDVSDTADFCTPMSFVHEADAALSAHQRLIVAGYMASVPSDWRPTD